MTEVMVVEGLDGGLSEIALRAAAQELDTVGNALFAPVGTARWWTSQAIRM